jgi:hypothetical protein
VAYDSRESLGLITTCGEREQKFLLPDAPGVDAILTPLSTLSAETSLRDYDDFVNFEALRACCNRSSTEPDTAEFVP